MTALAHSVIGCVFCERFAREYRKLEEIAVFEPLNPVVPGHLLVVPVQHVEDFTKDDEITGRTAAHAAMVVAKLRRDAYAEWNKLDSKERVFANYPSTDFNLITSAGRLATQTVNHLHMHIVPRRENDGLHLPWTGQVVDK